MEEIRTMETVEEVINVADKALLDMPIIKTGKYVVGGTLVVVGVELLGKKFEKIPTAGKLIKKVVNKRKEAKKETPKETETK